MIWDWFLLLLAIFGPFSSQKPLNTLQLFKNHTDTSVLTMYSNLYPFMKFQDWQSCIMPNFVDLGLILATFDDFSAHFFIMKASERSKTARKSYYYISFDYLVSIHSYLASFRTKRAPLALILRFSRFGANFGYFWLISAHFSPWRSPNTKKLLQKSYWHISFNYFYPFM